MENTRGDPYVKNMVLIKRLGHNLFKLERIHLGRFIIFITTQLNHMMWQLN